jgi:hypothetical protein
VPARSSLSYMAPLTRTRIHDVLLTVSLAVAA